MWQILHSSMYLVQYEVIWYSHFWIGGFWGILYKLNGNICMQHELNPANPFISSRSPPESDPNDPKNLRKNLYTTRPILKKSVWMFQSRFRIGFWSRSDPGRIEVGSGRIDFGSGLDRFRIGFGSISSRQRLGQDSSLRIKLNLWHTYT